MEKTGNTDKAGGWFSSPRHELKCKYCGAIKWATTSSAAAEVAEDVEAVAAADRNIHSEQSCDWR